MPKTIFKNYKENLLNDGGTFSANWNKIVSSKSVSSNGNRIADIKL